MTCFTANDLESKVAGVFVGFAGNTDRYETVPPRWTGSHDHGFMTLWES